MRWKTLLFIAVVGYGGWNYWQSRPVDVAAGAGPLAAQDPQQYGAAAVSLEKAGYQITPLAGYDLTARVLSVQPYRLGREADISPLDLALGWGPMSDSAVLEKITIRQSGRFYFWNVREFPIPQQQIETHSANTHLIPATASVEERIKSVRRGQVVHLRGYLVEAKSADGWQWRSSLSRDDTGDGACELMWVEQAEIL